MYRVYCRCGDRLEDLATPGTRAHWAHGYVRPWDGSCTEATPVWAEPMPDPEQALRDIWKVVQKAAADLGIDLRAGR